MLTTYYKIYDNNCHVFRVVRRFYFLYRKVLSFSRSVVLLFLIICCANKLLKLPKVNSMNFDFVAIDTLNRNVTRSRQIR